jgi:hypothetical protein
MWIQHAAVLRFCSDDPMRSWGPGSSIDDSYASWLAAPTSGSMSPASARIECCCRPVSASQVVAMLRPAAAPPAVWCPIHTAGAHHHNQSTGTTLRACLALLCMHGGHRRDATCDCVHVGRTWWPAMKTGCARSRWINGDCLDTCSSGTWWIDLMHC